MPLIVGLGNPGFEYTPTRHNIGWMVVGQAASRWSITFHRVGETRRGMGRIGEQSLCLALPLAWMNQTGPVVRTLLHELRLTPLNLIVVHDDMDLKLGHIRVKDHGGAGGHNGIRSLLSSLQSDQFIRLKVGIGRPPMNCDPTDYVLSPFPSEDSPVVDTVLSQAVDALECLVTEGVSPAMNRFNVRQKA